ncbi:hypothetical protein O3P69_009791 [Scylla paramamosain]|uniref:Uncharacterized protein n=1 Tax=Scylla paramamosain TaxID=85552 RepID=A0AAW0SLZ7_SCYPA
MGEQRGAVDGGLRQVDNGKVDGGHKSPQTTSRVWVIETGGAVWCGEGRGVLGRTGQTADRRRGSQIIVVCRPEALTLTSPPKLLPRPAPRLEVRGEGLRSAPLLTRAAAVARRPSFSGGCWSAVSSANQYSGEGSHDVRLPSQHGATPTQGVALLAQLTPHTTRLGMSTQDPTSSSCDCQITRESKRCTENNFSDPCWPEQAVAPLAPKRNPQVTCLDPTVAWGEEGLLALCCSATQQSFLGPGRPEPLGHGEEAAGLG